MSDQQNPPDLAFMLGRIQGDVKHILEALTRNQKQFSDMDAKIENQEKRIDKAEKFQVKVATILAVFTPILMALFTFGLRAFGL